MAFLEAKGITKRIGGLVAVDGVDFEVKQGEIVSLIGPNGAGKTTVFNLITGIYTLDIGQIWLDGKMISGLSPQQIVEAGVSRTFQNIRLFKNLRVIENVLVGAHRKTHYGLQDILFRTPRYRAGEKQSVELALRILHSIELDRYVDDYAGSLPYGLQRRLEIARAIATGAKILLLDEPAAGMDPHESEDLMNFIISLKNEGYTLLLIEHDMNLVMTISDRIYVLDYGKKIAEGLPHEIAANRDVIKAYLGGGDGQK